MPKEEKPPRPWREIAEELMKEQDSNKATTLVAELNRAIETKLNRARKLPQEYKQGSAA
jgi:hypothetical protein